MIALDQFSKNVFPYALNGDLIGYFVEPSVFTSSGRLK